MAVKYRCTKCDRKFIEWGVPKVKSGQACEDCHGEYLQQIGYDAAQATPRKKPALKRKRVRVAAEAEVAPTLAVFNEDETVMPDLDTLTSANGGANLEVEEFEPADAVEVVAGDDDEDADVIVPDAEAETVEDEVVKPVVDDDEEEEDDDE